MTWFEGQSETNFMSIMVLIKARDLEALKQKKNTQSKISDCLIK